MNSAITDPRRAGRGTLAAAALAFLAASAPAQLSFTGPTTLSNPTVPDPGAAPFFGRPLAAVGDRFLVGRPTADAVGLDAGEALLYAPSGSTWSVVATLRPASPSGPIRFGDTIDFAPARILVGEGGPDVVHVFDLLGGTWTEVATLAPSTAMFGFGASLRSVGSNVLVGAPLAVARVAVFAQVGSSWVEGPPLTPPGGATIDRFGETITSSGAVVAITARQSHLAATQAGAVFVFEDQGAGLVHAQTLVSPAPSNYTQFGYHAHIDDDTLLVSEVGAVGRVFAYTRVGGVWTLQQELVPPGGPVLWYGVNVQVQGDVATAWSPNALPTPRIEVFRRQSGVWSWKLALEIAQAEQSSISLTPELLVVGSPNEDSIRGIVRVWTVDDAPAIVPFCAGDGTGASCPCANAGGAGRGCGNSSQPIGALLLGSGDASLGHDTVRLAAAGTPPNATGLYFEGSATSGGGAGVVFGDGLRCAGGTIVRLTTRVAVGGESSIPEAGDPTISQLGSVPAPGATRHYQVWYRDVAAFCTPSAFNLTNGVRIAWTP